LPVLFSFDGAGRVEFRETVKFSLECLNPKVLLQ